LRGSLLAEHVANLAEEGHHREGLLEKVDARIEHSLMPEREGGVADMYSTFTLGRASESLSARAGPLIRAIVTSARRRWIGSERSLAVASASSGSLTSITR
jgi:hypothetical protein